MLVNCWDTCSCPPPRAERRTRQPGQSARHLAGLCRTETDAGDATISNTPLRYAGIELLRRTLGAARVPAVASDAASLAVIDTGLSLIRDGDADWGALAEPAFGATPGNQ